MLLLLFVAATAGAALAEGPPEPSPGRRESQPPTPAQVEAGLQATARKEEERQGELATPAARRRREESTDAYAGISASASEKLLESSFPEQLQALRAGPVQYLNEAKVLKVIDDTSAIVSHDGKRALLESPVPIKVENEAGKKEKPDLALGREGAGYLPANPPVALRIPEGAAGLIRLSESGIGVQQADARASSTGRLLGPEEVFFPEVAADTDLLAAPTAWGVELYDQLRSKESPEQLTFHLDLPAGDVLREVEGGAEVINSDGKAQARIPNPYAVDAEGTEVPVAFQVKGDSIILGVSHREQDLAYPILVDPAIEEAWSWLEWQGLGALSTWGKSGPTGKIELLTSCNTYCPGGSNQGLFLEAPSGYYSSSEYRAWSLNPTGNAIVEAAWLWNFWRENHSVNCTNAKYPEPHDYEGLWNGSGWSQLQTNKSILGGTEFPAWPGFGGYELYIGMGSNGGEDKCRRDIYVGGVAVALGDSGWPYWGYANSPTGWMDDSPLAVPVSASDEGLGVQEFVALYEEASDGETPYSCTGFNESPCPGTWSTNLVYEPEYLPTGEDQLKVFAIDAVGNKSLPKYVTVKVDHDKPILTLSGTLPPHSTLGMSKPEYSLKWKAEDGTESAPQSGAASLLVKVDGKVVHSESPGCSTQNCALENEWAFVASEYGSGEHKIEVIATDAVGNVAEQTLPVNDSPEVTSPTSGEHVSRRFRLTAAWIPTDYSQITWQYRLDSGKEWSDIPVGQVKTAAGDSVEWPATVSGQSSEPLFWDVAASGLSTADLVPLEVRAKLQGESPEGVSPAVSAKLDRGTGGPKDTSAEVGPGSVDLLTGNLSVPRTDVAIPVFGTALEFTRTYNSRDAESDPKGILGPGWIAGSPVEEAGADWKSARDANVAGEGPYAVLTDLEGYEYPFELTAGGSYISPPEMSGWVLSSTGAGFALVDPAGNSVVFGEQSAAGTFLPSEVAQPGGKGNKTQMVYELEGSSRRLKMLIGPSAEGVNGCDVAHVSTVPTTPGCRSLSFEYQHPSEWEGPEGAGDRLTSITYNGPSGESQTKVAEYEYDEEGRLVGEWDPRISPALKETYGYAVGGELKTVTPPGEEPWWLGYEEEPAGEAGGEPASPREGLVASYSFDEGSGSVAHDDTGNGHDGTVENATWLEAGKHGGALGFWSEDESCVTVPDSPDLQLREEFTLEAWVKPPAEEEGAPIFYKEAESGSSYGLFIGLTHTGKPEATVTTEEGLVRTEGEEVTPDEWTHLAATYDGQYIRLYADGELVDTSTAESTIESDGPLHIGCARNSGEGLDAPLDDARIYDRALSQEEVEGDEATAVEARTGEGHLRLHTVRRASLLPEGEPQTAQTTIVYNVPISGKGQAYDMSKAAVEEWGQQHAPSDATAVFPPDEVPASTPENYNRATVYYMDAEGQVLNTATPSGAGTEAPSISTTEADEHGNVLRELTPQNRLRALATGGDPVARSHELETRRTFDAEGTELLEEWGPLHEVKLESGASAEARLHRVITYEDPSPPEGTAPYYLPTLETSAAEIPSEEAEADVRSTAYEYDWTLRLPTKTIVDPGEGHLAIATTSVYDDATGMPIEQRQPSDPEGKGAGTTKTIYYSATGEGECKGSPQYANLPCKTMPAAQPGTEGLPDLLVTKYLKYNALGEPTEVMESPGGGEEHERITLTSYDAAGRTLTSKIEGGGKEVPETKTEYSKSSGQPTVQKFVCDQECEGGGAEYLSSFGTEGSGNGHFDHPADVAIDESGNLWVVDKENDRIEKFSPTGEFLLAAGSSGSGAGQLDSPSGIELDSYGDLDVTDTANNRVVRFRENGEFASAVGTDVNKTAVEAEGTLAERNHCTDWSEDECQAGVAGGAEGHMDEPIGIATSGGGNFFVVEKANDRVEKFNTSGELLASFGSSGTGAGQLSEPTAIAKASNGSGYFWVADTGNNRVEEWNSAYSYVRTAGSKGSGNGQFEAPGALEADAEGQLYVGDEGNQRVQELSTTGEYVRQFGKAGSGSGQLDLGPPFGLTIDEGGDILIADSGNDRIQRWAKESTVFNDEATTTTYDALGRVTQYEDADGNVAKTSYDVDGRPVKTEDAKGWQTLAYDPTSGLPVELEDSAAGTFTAEYDADGNMTARSLPNGLTASTTYNEADEPMSLAYTKLSSCEESCTWLSESLERSIYGQILDNEGTLVNDSYGYDKAGRLTQARETPSNGGCTTRLYAYDEDTNRTSLTTREPEGGECANSGGSEQKYSYDAADRLLGEGIEYDSFGRITSLPESYAGGHTLTTEYFATDMVAEQSQNGVTNTYELDASMRQRTRIQTGGSSEGVEVFHYDASGDATGWTERGSSWIREISDIGGDISAIQEGGSGVTFQLTNLHGDVVATADASPASTSLETTAGFDEFGNPKSGAAGRYGWLGGKSRRSELASGVIQMGARSYVPGIGRFISVDPVLGGSAGPYDYANADPVNGLDLTGTAAKRRRGPKRRRHACEIAEWGMTGQPESNSAGAWDVSAYGFARCTRSARRVRVKAEFYAGIVHTPRGVPDIPIPSASIPWKSCGNGGTKFSCEANVETEVTARPLCEESWPVVASVHFFIEWVTSRGNRKVISENRTMRSRISAYCPDS